MAFNLVPSCSRAHIPSTYVCRSRPAPQHCPEKLFVVLYSSIARLYAWLTPQKIISIICPSLQTMTNSTTPVDRCSMPMWFISCGTKSHSLSCYVTAPYLQWLHRARVFCLPVLDAPSCCQLWEGISVSHKVSSHLSAATSRLSAPL